MSRKRSAAPRASSGRASRSAGSSGARALIALEQRLALGHVEGVVALEAPGVERDGDVVGQRIVAGEIEVDQAGELVAEEEDVVGKEIGVDDALRQVGRPVGLQVIELLLDDGGRAPARSRRRAPGSAA